MGDKLLIRAFDVEVGDCFYVRIPNARLYDGVRDDFHILIDCGTKGSKTLPRAALEALVDDLPVIDGKSQLDLLVVTHEHQDHIKGLDPADFADIEIENVWVTTAMDPDHPQAKLTNSLHGFASDAMRRLAGRPLALSPELRDLMELYGVDNDTAVAAIRDTLPGAAGPVYVSAGMTSEDLGLWLDGSTIHVLAPERNIDRFYLGEAEAQLNALRAGAAHFGRAAEPDAAPANIGTAAFRRLQSRMLSNAFAFAELASRIKNNTSVVLLIEWEGRRLLFVGDAEWEGEFAKGKQNGSWNVMWNERHGLLAQPIDFLKVGHHGSTNATPWDDGDGGHTEPVEILDAILPLPSAGKAPTAQALVSTKRRNYKTIPRAELLAEIGRRVTNTRDYHAALTGAGLDPTTLPHYTELEAPWIHEPQPLRTDLEGLITGQAWVDVEISPAGN